MCRMIPKSCVTSTCPSLLVLLSLHVPSQNLHDSGFTYLCALECFDVTLAIPKGSGRFLEDEAWSPTIRSPFQIQELDIVLFRALT